VDDIHFNPVKHGWVSTPGDWPHSTRHRFIELGIVAPDWGGAAVEREGDYGES
jgi:putative transposase